MPSSSALSHSHRPNSDATSSISFATVTPSCVTVGAP